MLSDGDLSSLENLKRNLELNQLSTRTDLSERSTEDPDLISKKLGESSLVLPFKSESTSKNKYYLLSCAQQCVARILNWSQSQGHCTTCTMHSSAMGICRGNLGADVIYDPLCLPHLVQVLNFLLDRGKLRSHLKSETCNGIEPDNIHIEGETHGADNRRGSDTQAKAMPDEDTNFEYACHASKEGPVAFFASVIRNVDTFNCFLALADEANLNVEDVTEKFMPFNLLPYLHSYARLSIRLFTLTRL
ncbi:hypothetical protein Acr_10g0002320 [Actinidia rufa]|uniref:Uncharacterized protein n=1 Tax=Actinidia rufa TaxID=165716 RepID=A0A7J0FAC0_9ERIC|nr:hypothetical protein Acr_10g0002320 [Actinidia rufa]